MYSKQTSIGDQTMQLKYSDMKNVLNKMTNLEKFTTLCDNFDCLSREQAEDEVSPKKWMRDEILHAVHLDFDGRIWKFKRYNENWCDLTEDDCNRFFEDGDTWDYWWN